jgi:hypothetical protein
VVNTNLPRFDYNPATLAPKGLLIEEARTNIFLESAGFDTVLWNKGNATVTANAATAPDGTLSADKIVENTANNFHRISQVPVLTAVPHTVTIYAKPAGRDWLYMGNASASQTAYFNVSTGVIGTIVGATTATISPAGNGWYRCSITSTPSAGAQNYSFYTANADGSFFYTGDGVSGLFVWGAQLEAGAFATSYIPTVASQATRNPDLVSMTGTNFSDWYNASEGAFLAKFSFPAIPATQFRYVLSANDGTATNFIAVAGNTTSNVPAGRVIASSSTQASMGGGAITANQQAIGVIAYKQDSFAYGQNGATIGTDATGLVPTVNRLDIGALTTSFACCHIQRVAYWPQRIINNEALAFSK